MKADAERLRSVEGADGGLTHAGQQPLRACSLLQVFPAHEQMFAHRADGRGRRGPDPGWLGTRHGSKLPLLFGTAICAVSFSFLAAAHSERWEIYAGTC